MKEQKYIANCDKVKLMCFIIVIGFTLSVILHYILGSYAGLKPYYYTTFLFDPTDKFNDFYNIFHATENLDPYAVPLSVYFPFTFFVVYPLTFLKAGAAFILTLIIFTSFLLWYLMRYVPANNALEKYFYIFVFTLMSYPVLFNIDRGNFEIYLFVFMILFVFFFQKEQYFVSVIFLSLAISMKMYPGVFIVLFLFEKKYRYVFYAAILTVLLTICSASLLNGGLLQSFVGLSDNLLYFNKTYLSGNLGLQHNSSLYGLIRLIGKHSEIVQHYIKYYSLIAIVIFVFIALYVIKYHEELWKKVSLLVFAMILLPQVSFDYKLIHLYLPLMLFINSLSPSKYDKAHSIMFSLLLIPKDYIPLGHGISSAVILNPLLMLSIAGLIVYERLHEVKNEDTSHRW